MKKHFFIKLMSLSASYLKKFEDGQLWTASSLNDAKAYTSKREANEELARLESALGKGCAVIHAINVFPDVEDMYSKGDFCKCKTVTAISAESSDFGYYDLCESCGKPLEDGFHYFNHSDGEDYEGLGY